jgi:hypothetical protein
MSGLRYQMYALIEASYVGTFLRVIKVTYLRELAVGEPPNYLLPVLVPRAFRRKRNPQHT